MIIQSCIGYIKCLSIEAGTSRGGEGSWGKNRNQTQTLKGSEGAGSEARNTARSQRYCCRVLSDGLLQSIMPLLCLKQPPTGLHKTATMLHKASRWARLPPISTAVLHMITSNWTPPEMTHDITNRELWCFAFKIKYH